MSQLSLLDDDTNRQLEELDQEAEDWKHDFDEYLNEDSSLIDSKWEMDEEDVAQNLWDESNAKIGSSRTWLRYFGGKTIAVPHILKSFPEGITEMMSPFVGGGSVELAAAASGIRVYSYDKFELLVKLWNTMFENAGVVAERAIELYPMDNATLKEMFKSGFFYNCEDLIEQCATCWVANKQDWNGRFLNASGFYDHRKNMFIKRRRIVRRALNPKFWHKWDAPNLSVECAIFEDSLDLHPDLFVYADPPYIGNERVYGKYRTKKTDPRYKEFNHYKFAEKMIARAETSKGGFAISYEDDKRGIIKRLYKNFEIIPMQWHQGSVASRQSSVAKRKRRDSNSTKEILIIHPPAINPLRS